MKFEVQSEEEQAAVIRQAAEIAVAKGSAKGLIKIRSRRTHWAYLSMLLSVATGLALTSGFHLLGWRRVCVPVLVSFIIVFGIGRFLPLHQHRVELKR